MEKKQTQQLNENKKLPPEQKEFCREVANGMSPRLAYIKAFDCKESAASACASRLLKRANIKEEVSRLRKKAHEVHKARTEGQEERKLWTKAERMERLQEWAQASVEKDDIPTAIKCVDTLNKMDGAYETKVSTEQQSVREQREMAEERADRMKKNILHVIYEQQERAGSSSHIDRNLRA